MDQSFKTSPSRQISGIFMMRFLYTLIFSLLLPLELISLERSKGFTTSQLRPDRGRRRWTDGFWWLWGEVSTPHITALGDRRKV